MIVSWDWLSQYVTLPQTPDELAARLMMAGLNHESTTKVDGDTAIDLEVTSNRPDCLGHIGIAREVAVLTGQALKLPAAAPPAGATAVASLISVTIECPALCPRYTARVIRGVKVGPSPAWLVRRLRTIGIATVSNVVDITNYVLMECGQPLHAFDLARLAGRKIVVREAAAGEKFQAIDHKEYELTRGMCVIADAQRAVAIGGVMGGADSEVTASTTELLIESAAFAPISIRNTARRLSLFSPSSYRFERGPDPASVDWASRRCCELVLELCGGELAEGVIDVGQQSPPRTPITLRLPQIPRILGIEVPSAEVRRILAALGNRELKADAASIEVVPPTWRRDLDREIDLIEEVARVHGYEKIPEDTRVPMVPSHRSDEDRVLSRVRNVLTAAGFDEALTASVVDEPTSQALSPWTDAEPLITATPLLRGATHLRRSLVPSLLGVRRTNENLANPRIELFETAKIYLPLAGALPNEEKMIGLCSGQDFSAVKGVIETLIESLHSKLSLEVVEYGHPLLTPSRAAELRLGGERFAILGELTPAALRQFQLRGNTTVAELRLALLVSAANLVPQYQPLSAYPAVERDLNFEVAEAVRWADLAATVQSIAGAMLERLAYVETYRDAQRLGPDRKSLVLKLVLRRNDGTLKSDEADVVVAAVVAACAKSHQAKLRA
ncbi:MAG: phenylalanine--tRNA ligase subunit beta [Planctomycetes bacterium]|nr:phenylalanine--tRNA ligase subunit beta [Planctomycetota bacterium]